MLATLALFAVAGQGFKELAAGLSGSTPILTFHDVIPRRDATSLWFDCTTSEFSAILDWLAARKAHPITVEALYRHLTEKAPLPKNAILITFADNYLGFYLRALPILRSRRIPAVMFVHTGYVGSPIGRPKMSWSQLRELDREGLVTVASQTVTHPPDLRTLKGAALDLEMTRSRSDLERRLGHPVRIIAYPNGKWNSNVVAAARRAGYVLGFTEELRPAEKASSVLAVPRYVHTKYRLAWSDAGRR